MSYLIISESFDYFKLQQKADAILESIGSALFLTPLLENSNLDWLNNMEYQIAINKRNGGYLDAISTLNHNLRLAKDYVEGELEENPNTKYIGDYPLQKVRDMISKAESEKKELERLSNKEEEEKRKKEKERQDLLDGKIPQAFKQAEQKDRERRQATAQKPNFKETDDKLRKDLERSKKEVLDMVENNKATVVQKKSLLQRMANKLDHWLTKIPVVSSLYNLVKRFLSWIDDKLRSFRI